MQFRTHRHTHTEFEELWQLIRVKVVVVPIYPRYHFIQTISLRTAVRLINFHFNLLSAFCS